MWFSNTIILPRDLVDIVKAWLILGGGSSPLVSILGIAKTPKGWRYILLCTSPMDSKSALMSVQGSQLYLRVCPSYRGSLTDSKMTTYCLHFHPRMFLLNCAHAQQLLYNCYTLIMLPTVVPSLGRSVVESIRFI